MPRLDRVLRTVVLVPVFALCATLVTLAVAWILLQTSIGQDEIREFAEERLQGQLGEGTATIKGADFSLSGELSLSDIKIHLDDKPAIEVEKLVVDVELFSFLRGELRIPKVHAIGPTVDARLDLKRLAPPPEPDEEEGGLSVRLDEIEIDDGVLRTAEANIDQLNLVVEIDAELRRVTINSASAHWVERDRTATVSGVARQVEGAWIALGSKVEVGDVVVKVDEGVYQPETGEVAVTGSATGTAAHILKLGGEWLPPEADNWRGDLDLDLTAMRAGRADAWEVSADGKVGAAAVTARARIDGTDVRGRVRAHDVEPAALYEGAPDAAVDLKLTVGVEEATLTARGVVEGLEFDHLVATAKGTLKEGFVTADMTDRRGVVHAEASLRRFDDGTIQIDKSELHGDVTDVIAQFVKPSMRQLVVKKLNAIGPTTDLEVSGDLHVVGLREGDVRVAVADVELTVPHVSLKAKDPRFGGTLDVTARGLNVDGRRFGYLRAIGGFRNSGSYFDVDVTARQLGFADLARGDVVVDRDRYGTRVALGDVWVTTDTLTWQGSGGSIVIFTGGRVDIDEVKLESPAGKLEVDGVLDAPRARRAEGKLIVKVEDLDLATAAPTIASVLKVHQPLEGRVQADIEVARRGRVFETAARADYVGVVWRPGAAAANGFVRGKLGKGKLVAQVEVKPRDHHGRVSFQVEANAPRDTMDIDAWRRLDLPDIDRSELTLQEIDNHVVESFAGDVLPYDGAVEGTVTFPHEGAQAFFVDLEVSNVATPWLDSVGADVKLTWDGSALSGPVALSHQGDDVITGEVGLDRGFQQLWRRPIREFLAARVKVDGEIRAFDLNRLERAGFVHERLLGQFDGDVDVEGTVERPKVILSEGRASNVRAAGIQISQVKVGADWEGKVVNGNVRAEQSAGGSIKVNGGYSWEQDGSMSGGVKATSFDLKALRVLAPDDTHPLADLAGRLDGEVNVSGSLERPDVRGTAAVHDAVLLLEGGARRIDRGDLRLKFEGDYAVIEQLQGYSGEGLAKGTGNVQFEDFQFELEVTTDKFPLVIGPYVAAIDAKGSFAGRWLDGWWETRAEVTEGTVLLSDTGRELQDIGPLEDVIFVERIGGEREVGAGPVVKDAMPIEVEIVTIEPVRVKSKEVDAMITADVTLRFQGVLTWLQGIVEVDRGSFTLFERSYQIARGIAKFYGPTPVDPDLDIELRHTFPAALVSIFVNDKLTDPRIVFQSDPADYDDTQILQIILGQNPDEADDAGLTPDQRAASAVGNVLLGRVVRDTLNIPVDVIRTHPDGYEIGKYFFDGTVLVGYRSRNSGEVNKNANEGTIEWRLRRNVVIEGFYGDNSIGAADILYIIRF